MRIIYLFIKRIYQFICAPFSVIFFEVSTKPKQIDTSNTGPNLGVQFDYNVQIFLGRKGRLGFVIFMI